MIVQFDFRTRQILLKPSNKNWKTGLTVNIRKLQGGHALRR